MTEQELNSVRDLKKRIRDLETRLQTLRLSAENLVPILDGLPHSTEAKSRVEKLALEIVEKESELTALREQIILDKSRLADLILRYIECLSFRETARRMKYGLRHIYKIHEKFLKNGTPWHSCGTKEKLI